MPEHVDSQYNLPVLPEGQRWYASVDSNKAPVIKLQEKCWWGWRTIARRHYFLSHAGDVGSAMRFAARKVLEERVEQNVGLSVRGPVA